MKNSALRAKWKSLHQNGEFRNVLREEIRDSWERSYDYGVDPYKRENSFIVTENELKKYREKSQLLYDASMPVMQNLLRFVTGSGFVVALCDPNLCLLEVLGDPSSLEWARNARAVPGSLWSEELVGANAAAIGLAQARPISVLGYEHFCLFSHVAACTASPVRYQDKLIGGLGLLAPYNLVNNHTLGMTVAAAMHIESVLHIKRSENLFETAIDSMTEGVFTLDSHGIITSINEKCEKILDLDKSLVVDRSIYDVLNSHPDNQYFVNQITRNKAIADETFKLFIGKNSISCSVTANRLKNMNSEYEGVIVVLRESNRINRLVRKVIGSEAKVTFDDIVHKSQSFSHTIKMAQTVAASTSNVLLLGESGTGKDLIAQAIHNASPRRDKSFIAINCAALPRDLIASELFGYEEGAFTGASKGGKIGKFELAEQGTLFLDEIGDMPIDLQASLLRILEERKIMKVGGSKLVPVDVRIIAATNIDIEQEIARGRFRRDLFYRLGVIKINIPPLRERPGEVSELTRVLVERTCKRFSKAPLHLDKEVLNAFEQYEWPGNVRELQNVIECAIQFTPENNITLEVIKLTAPHILDSHPTMIEDHETMPEERQQIIIALNKHKYNKTEAAKALGISRATLYRKITELNIN